MEDRITLDGKKYISSKRAAQLGGYTKDYIGQMCRSGKLSAKLLGRNWYILEDSLTSHKRNKKSTNNILDRTNISYTKETSAYKVMVDDRPLNPTPVKVKSTTVSAPKKASSERNYKVVTRTPKEKRRLPVLKMAIVIGLLLAIISTLSTEGKVVYNTSSDNLFAGVEFVELDRIISEINAIFSR